MEEKEKSETYVVVDVDSVLFVLKQKSCLEKFRPLMKLNHIITSIQMSGHHGCMI